MHPLSLTDNQVPFEGIHYQLWTAGFVQADFDHLEVGDSKCVSVDIAALHTLDKGGEFVVVAEGALPYAEDGSTSIAGSYNYDSNKLNITIDGQVAATVPKAINKRQNIESTCTGKNLTAVQTAVKHCHWYANAAADAAAKGTKLDVYFKSNASSVATTVSARLKAIAEECHGQLKPGVNSTCVDAYYHCG